jgi:hypothetical protein
MVSRAGFLILFRQTRQRPRPRSAPVHPWRSSRRRLVPCRTAYVDANGLGFPRARAYFENAPLALSRLTASDDLQAKKLQDYVDRLLQLPGMGSNYWKAGWTSPPACIQRAF